jgi:hypothetical protein
MNPGSSLPLSCSICSASVYTKDGCLKGGAVAFIYSEFGREVDYTVKLSNLWVKFTGRIYGSYLWVVFMGQLHFHLMEFCSL